MVRMNRCWTDSEMRNYVIRRVLLIVPTLFIVSVLVFLSLRFIPGDVIDIMMSRTRDAYAGREALEKHLGLDKPLVVQYGKWVFGIVTRGDLGTSLYGGHSVTSRVFNRLPTSFELGLIALVISLIIALPIGVYSAIRQDWDGRLHRTQRRHHLHFDPRILDRDNGDDLPAHLVGVVSAAGADTVR